MTRHVHPAIKSQALRDALAARLWSMRIDWHIVGWWAQVHEITVSCYADAQRIMDSGSYAGKEF